jgi:hypothetical protein
MCHPTLGCGDAGVAITFSQRGSQGQQAPVGDLGSPQIPY